jgi:glycerol uptake facilitator-like aquaporin
MARTPLRTAGWRRTVGGELLAEFLGTLVLIAFGDGVVAMAVAALNQSGRGTQIFAASGDWLLIAWGWALAVAFGVYVAGGVSGAHINPAVTLALAVKRDFPWRKVIPYWGAQLVGAFVGARWSTWSTTRRSAASRRPSTSPAAPWAARPTPPRPSASSRPSRPPTSGRA